MEGSGFRGIEILRRNLTRKTVARQDKSVCIADASSQTRTEYLLNINICKALQLRRSDRCYFLIKQSKMRLNFKSLK
jgi:hypothetical protein